MLFYKNFFLNQIKFFYWRICEISWRKNYFEILLWFVTLYEHFDTFFVSLMKLILSAYANENNSYCRQWNSFFSIKSRVILFAHAYQIFLIKLFINTCTFAFLSSWINCYRWGIVEGFCCCLKNNYWKLLL